MHGSCHRTRRDASCSTTGYMFLLPQRKGFETARSSLYLYPLSLCSSRRRGENESRCHAPHAKLFPLFISALGSRKQQKEWGRFFLLAAANAMHLIMWRARATTPANLITIERERFEVPKCLFPEDLSCHRVSAGTMAPTSRLSITTLLEIERKNHDKCSCRRDFRGQYAVQNYSLVF